jgi:1-aminocyclopropane-1-carboxylate deaminase/D-cysteine desulfhydrase-like pyridoxal-dependent ACC family enzyme
MQKKLSRRKFLWMIGASTAAAGIGGFLFKDALSENLENLITNRIDFQTSTEDFAAGKAGFTSRLPHEACIQPGELPTRVGQGSERLAITRYFPQLDYASGNPAKVQIINVYHQDFPRIAEKIKTVPTLHNSLFQIKADPCRFMIPWVPLFPKLTPINKLEHGWAGSEAAEGVFIKDEGSSRIALFGNKARKYEFAFPFCMQTRAKKIVTFGSLGSNHCIYTSLTAACARLGERFGREEPEVIVNLYPQQFNPSILKKLRYLLALGARVRFLDGDFQVGVQILANRLREHFSPCDDLAYYDPGGSNPLTTLSHINAVFELNDQIEQGSAPFSRPPDYIFVPLGSGGTAVGLALGCHLLGWNTIVVGTTSQDKSIWERAVVNGRPGQPFLVQNAIGLLERTIELLLSFGVSNAVWNRLSARSVLSKNFLFDNVTWKPAYGIPSEKTKALISAMRDQNGVELDSTFSGKAFTTLVNYAEKGILKGKSVLFWNTHQRFDFMAHEKVRDVDLKLLPGNLTDYLSRVCNVNFNREDTQGA